MTDYPFLISTKYLEEIAKKRSKEFSGSRPYPNIVLDDFLPKPHIDFLCEKFPLPNDKIWLDWSNQNEHQFNKQALKCERSFEKLDPSLLLAIHEFNSWKFISFLEKITGITKLLPDPYFRGGGLHQIISDGILDIHTDFNEYKKLGLYRRLNVLLYLTEEWKEGDGGELELWDGDGKSGTCITEIPPIKNRLVIFKTDKNSFHGHSNPWSSNKCTRRSLALYYYTAEKVEGEKYDNKTDFQGVVSKKIQDKRLIQEKEKERKLSSQILKDESKKVRVKKGQEEKEKIRKHKRKREAGIIYRVRRFLNL